jgi:hypothetical protein
VLFGFLVLFGFVAVLFGFVSGHDFSRAVKVAKSIGL